MSARIEKTSPHTNEMYSRTIRVQLVEHKEARLLFIDNLRVALTIQVIVFHLAITYGAIGPWYYKEPTDSLVAIVLLSMFVAASQAFFMGLFFLISAYFTPGAYDRKGGVNFLKNRLSRLGIPLLVYDLVIHPSTLYLVRGTHQPYWRFLDGYLLHFNGIGTGPLWFVEVLLIFAGLYVLWHWLTWQRVMPHPMANALPSPRVIILFILALAVVNFVVRIWFPIAWIFPPLNFQLAYFAQYIALFVIGIISYRRNWLLEISDGMGEAWQRVALVAIVLLSIISAIVVVSGGPVSFMGGLNWQALFYALWEATFCLGMCIGLLVFFRKHFNRQGKWAKWLSTNAYTAYIIHAPVIAFLAYVLRDIHLYPLLKFALVSLVAVPLVFLISHFIRNLPLTHKIL